MPVFNCSGLLIDQDGAHYHAVDEKRIYISKEAFLFSFLENARQYRHYAGNVSDHDVRQMSPVRGDFPEQDRGKLRVILHGGIDNLNISS